MKFKKVFLFVLMFALFFIAGCNTKMRTVTFDSNGGTEVSSVEVEKGKTITEPAAPTKEDEKFLGWYLDGRKFSFDTKIEKNITLKARWSGDIVNQYTVAFKDGDGNIIAIQSVNEGDAAKAPDVPFREGYKFIGWDIDFSCVMSDLEVVAQYEVDPDAVKYFTVTFTDYNGKVLKEEKVERGKDAVAPEEPTRDGYFFKCWNKDFTNVQGNLMVRALYVSEDDEFNIIYNLNGGAWGYASKAEYVGEFLKDFYKFVQPKENLDSFMYGTSSNEYLGTWKEYIGGSVGKENKLLYNNNIDANNEGYFFNCKAYKAKWHDLAKWVKGLNNRFGGNNYEYGALDFYRYIINDPDQYLHIYGDNFYKYPSLNEPTQLKFKFSQDTIKLHNPMSDKFLGWYLDSNFNGEPVTEIPAKTYTDFEVYAKWDTTVTYEIYFNTKNGQKIDPITAKFGETIKLPDNLQMADHTFLGWYYGETFISNPFEFRYNCSITLDAHWRKNEADLVNLEYNGTPVKYYQSNEIVKIPDTYIQPDEQLRAAWISSLVDDFQPSPNEATMKSRLTEVLDLMESYNMNCFIFHIRTMNNAFYKTHLAPIQSDYGTYKSFEEWDYLTWLISECHKRGMEFHAWMNPYRIKAYGYAATATPNDVAKEYKDYPENPAHDPSNILMGYRSDGSQGAILNPAKKVVQDYIIKVCLEVMQNYDVDAIHFDDYFYTKMKPTNDILRQPDQQDYINYCKANPRKFDPNSRSDKEDWRRMNVDTFIHNLSTSMRNFNNKNNKHVQLGISPTGIYKNGNGSVNSGSHTAGQEHYKDYLYCDTVKWIKNEWIDYILPQSYWGFTHRVAKYADVMDWWNKVVEGTKVNLYSGIGIYMYGEGVSESWGHEPYEVSNQILYTTKLKNVKGVSFFCYKNLKEYISSPDYVPYKGLMKIINEYWTTKVPTPSTMAGKRH